MAHRIVTISNPSWLKKDLEQLSVSQEGQEVGRVPIEDLAVLILESHGIALTQELVVALSKANVAIVFCDERHLPLSCVVPFEANALHAKVVREQADCSLPKKKQLWKQVVQAKIGGQAQTLRACLPHSRDAKATAKYLDGLAANVKSGDSDNLEARAAAEYFPALFGRGFMRDRDLPGVNAALNYGYAIVRAMVARAIVGAGLHPALGLMHRGPGNPFNLADDAIEPLRPIVDQHVFAMSPDLREDGSLAKETRADLLKLTVLDLYIAGKPTGIEPALARYAASLREGICGEGRKLVIPHRRP